MQFLRKHNCPACSVIKRSAKLKSPSRLLRWLWPITGFFALIWFLVRVIPKPSRATYPCQRIAFPLASSFIVWLLGLAVSVAAFRKAKYYFERSRFVIGAICLTISLAAVYMAISGGNSKTALADPTPNDAMGVAKGVNPGRVVWVHDVNATDWDGPGDGHWWQSSHTNMEIVDQMMSLAIRALASEPGSVEAWDKIFRYFNQAHGKGDVGYQPGEKITIKVNLVGCIWFESNVDTNTYDLISKMDYMNTSPQMMLALLRQLVYVVEVNEADIAIGDTLCYFPNQYYDICHDEFPNVRYLDYAGGNEEHERTAVQQSSTPIYWSSHPSGSQDYVPASYDEADYIINMANFKSHTMGAVTLCGKNHYGSLIRWPAQSGYYDLHDALPSRSGGMGQYRTLVDLMGHPHIGGKTLLYLIDGLYAGEHPVDNQPTKMTMAPFNGDWSSSLFVSQDPVAIDSAAFDFLWAEAGEPGTQWSNVIRSISGGDDYLHEAAEANNPASGTFYDPNNSGDVNRLASQGVHEHWNNATDKQYSCNLGTGDGIELIALSGIIPADIYVDGRVDCRDFAVFASSWLSRSGEPNWNLHCDIAGLGDGFINELDLGVFADYWLAGVQ